MSAPRRRFLLLTLTLAFLAGRIAPSRAQLPFGERVAAFPVQAAGLLADPVRPRVYATQPAQGTVSVVETTTLRVIATIPVGPNARELALSADASRLFISTGVYGYNKPGGVAVLDLDTLQTLPGFTLPTRPGSLVAGLDGRLYVSAASPGTALYQVDTATGAVQAIGRGPLYDDHGLLQVSPSAHTLYVAAGTLLAFDVSTSTAVFQGAGSRTTNNAPDFKISHDGNRLVVPCELTAYMGVDAFFAWNDFNAVVGEYADADTSLEPAPVLFSADDTLLYAYQDDGSKLATVDTGTYTVASQAGLGRLGQFGNAVTSLALDSTGSYLFLGRDDDNTADAASPGLLVLSTGRGTPPPPVVKIQAAQAHIPSGGQGRFVVSREGDLSRDITVRYGVGGYGHNTAALPLKGSRILKAGRARTGFNVIGTGVGSGEVAISLLDDPAYTVARKRNARIYIDPAPTPTP